LFKSVINPNPTKVIKAMKIDPDKIETIAVNILTAVAIAGCLWLAAGWLIGILDLHTLEDVLP